MTAVSLNGRTRSQALMTSQQSRDARLAVFVPLLGVRSETFIRRHVQELVPDRTVVVTKDATGHDTGHWTTDSPVLALNALPALSLTRRLLNRVNRSATSQHGSHRIERSVEAFLTSHNVGVGMGEFLSWSVKWLEPAQKLGIPFFGHAHGCDVSSDLRHPRWREAYTKYNQSGGIITMSEFSRDKLVAIGLEPAKVHVVPYGVDVADAPPDRVDGEFVSVLAVGRMTAKKAPILVLDSFRRALKQYPALHLDYVGDGELFQAAQQFVAAFDLAGHVTLHGGRSSAEVAALLRTADIFVQHSMTDPVTGDEEGLPVAILEAMATALPVVSTKHAGIPEAVRDGQTGLLVAEGDSKGMADALIALARSPSMRRNMGFAGWELARKHYSWARERADLLRVLGLASGPAAGV